MLKYLRDNSSASQQEPAGAAASKAKASGEAGGQEDEYLTVAADTKKVRKSTILLIGLFAIGIIGLFLMIKKSQPEAASAAEVSKDQLQMEKAISQLSGIKDKMFQGVQNVVQKFYGFSDVEQVEVDELQKNPFKLERYYQGLDEQADVDMRGRMKHAADRMELYSVMATGGERSCVINGKLLYEGDRVEDFVVQEIGDDRVRVGNDNLDIMLKLEE
jgi:hypothetical protein